MRFIDWLSSTTPCLECGGPNVSRTNGTFTWKGSTCDVCSVVRATRAKVKSYVADARRALGLSRLSVGQEVTQ